MSGDKEYLLDRDTIIVSETDKKGKIVYANSDFCKLSHYSKNELIGKAHSIVRHMDMPRAAFKDLWDTVSRDEVWSGVVKNRSKDGGFYWVHARVYPSKRPNGDVKLFSVRVKPTQNEIKRAENLYKTMK